MLEKIEPQLLLRPIVLAVAHEVDHVTEVTLLKRDRFVAILAALIQPVPDQVGCVNDYRPAEYLKQSTHPSLPKAPGTSITILRRYRPISQGG
jgi:hypothetical protein